MIGTHEFAYTNKVLMEPDGYIHPTTDKSKVIKLLEDLVIDETTETSNQDSDLEDGSEETCLIVDGMSVVHELMAVKNFKTCKELSVKLMCHFSIQSLVGISWYGLYLTIIPRNRQ